MLLEKKERKENVTKLSGLRTLPTGFLFYFILFRGCISLANVGTKIVHTVKMAPQGMHKVLLR